MCNIQQMYRHLLKLINNNNNILVVVVVVVVVVVLDELNHFQNHLHISFLFKISQNNQHYK